MNGLEAKYGNQVEFFHLDWDNDEHTAIVMDNYAVRRRSTYVILDANGEIIQSWTGPLSEEAVTEALNEILAQ